MLFMVVVLVMALVVVSPVLLSAIRLLLQPGTLVLPYHLNKAMSTTYAVRGCISSSGLFGGAFFCW